MLEKMELWPGRPPCGGATDFVPCMEISLLPGSAVRGAVIVLPGGAYSHLADHEGTPIAQKFNALGFHAFVVRYRIAPERYPAPQLDALRAIKLVRANAVRWRIDPGQIAILGFSAGGHLASCCSVLYDELHPDAGDAADGASARPDAAIYCYALHSLGEEFGHVGSGRNLLGEAYDRDPQLRHSLELYDRISENTPPCFIWHTATDGSVNVRNALIYAQRMWEKKLTAELHVFPEGRHGLGLAEQRPDVRAWPELAARFLTVSCHFAAVPVQE